MTQEGWIVLLLKIGIISGFTSLLAWVAVYTWLTRGGAWRNPIGITFILKSLLIAALFVPTGLSLFFRLSRRDSLIAGWADVILIGLVGPVMAWRSLVFIRLDRRARQRERKGEAAQ